MIVVAMVVMELNSEFHTAELAIAFQQEKRGFSKADFTASAQVPSHVAGDLA